MNTPKPRTSGTPSKGGSAASSTLGGPPSSQMPISLSFAVSARPPASSMNSVEREMNDAEHKHDTEDTTSSSLPPPAMPRVRNLANLNIVGNGEENGVRDHGGQGLAQVQQNPPDINFGDQSGGNVADMNMDDNSEGDAPRLSRSVSFHLSDDEQSASQIGERPPHVSNASNRPPGKSNLSKSPRHPFPHHSSSSQLPAAAIPSSPIIHSHRQRPMVSSTSRQPDGGFTRPQSRPTPSRLNFSSQNSNVSGRNSLSSQTSERSRHSQPVGNNLLSWKPSGNQNKGNNSSASSSSRNEQKSKNGLSKRAGDILRQNQSEHGASSAAGQFGSQSNSSQVGGSSNGASGRVVGFRVPHSRPKKSLRKRSSPSTSSGAHGSSNESTPTGASQNVGSQFKRPRSSSNFRPPRPLASSQRRDPENNSRRSQPQNFSQSSSQRSSQPPTKSGLTQFQYNSRNLKAAVGGAASGAAAEDDVDSQRTALRELSHGNSQARQKPLNLLQPKRAHPAAGIGIGGGGQGLGSSLGLGDDASSSSQASVSQSFSQMMQAHSNGGTSAGAGNPFMDDLSALDEGAKMSNTFLIKSSTFVQFSH